MLHFMYKIQNPSYFCGNLSLSDAFAKSIESLYSQAMGHRFHQMSPAREPATLYNNVIHLCQWLRKNVVETLYQPPDFCYDQHSGVSVQIQNVRPYKKTNHKGRKPLNTFVISFWSFYFVFVICTFTIGNALCISVWPGNTHSTLPQAVFVSKGNRTGYKQ